MHGPASLMGFSRFLHCVTRTLYEHGTWQMMKRIHSSKVFPSPHTGDALFKMMIKFLTNFNLEDKIASESEFSTSGRVLSIRRTRLTPASLEMCMCLKDHLDAKERKQDKCHLEIPLDFEEDVFDDEVQRNEAIPLSDEEIALDASGEGTLSPGGPRYDYMMSSEAEDE
ncbi:zinc finger BED domain-containing protein RICESLEEPER 2 [Tanacetum coccineum]